MTSIETRYPKAALEQARDFLVNAAGDEGTLPRPALGAALAALEGSARGLAAGLYNYAYETEAVPQAVRRAVVHRGDLAPATEKAKASLIDRYDLNGDGMLSEAELAQLNRNSGIGRLAVEVGRALKAAEPSGSESLAARKTEIETGLARAADDIVALDDLTSPTQMSAVVVDGSVRAADLPRVLGARLLREDGSGEPSLALVNSPRGPVEQHLLVMRDLAHLLERDGRGGAELRALNDTVVAQFQGLEPVVLVERVKPVGDGWDTETSCLAGKVSGGDWLVLVRHRGIES